MLVSNVPPLSVRVRLRAFEIQHLRECNILIPRCLWRSAISIYQPQANQFTYTPARPIFCGPSATPNPHLHATQELAQDALIPLGPLCSHSGNRNAYRHLHDGDNDGAQPALLHASLQYKDTGYGHIVGRDWTEKRRRG